MEERRAGLFSRRWLAAALALAAVLVLVFVWRASAATPDAFAARAPKAAAHDLAAFWEASPDFLAESGLDQMALYLSADARGYLLMIDEEDVAVANEPLRWRVTGATRAAENGAPRTTGTLHLEAEGSSLPFPQTLVFVYDGGDYALTIYDAGTVYGHFYRDNLATAAARAAAEEAA